MTRPCWQEWRDYLLTQRPPANQAIAGCPTITIWTLTPSPRCLRFAIACALASLRRRSGFRHRSSFHLRAFGTTPSGYQCRTVALAGAVALPVPGKSAGLDALGIAPPADLVPPLLGQNCRSQFIWVLQMMHPGPSRKSPAVCHCLRFGCSSGFRLCCFVSICVPFGTTSFLCFRHMVCIVFRANLVVQNIDIVLQTNVPVKDITAFLLAN